MRPQSPRLDLIPEADPSVLRRWGVTDCGRVDRRALTRSLTLLQDDEVAPPADTTRLIRHIRDRYHRALVGVIEDAVALATACEAAHGGQELWPHGLSDRLMGILESLEHHQQREDAVVFPMLLAEKPQAAEAARIMEAEHARIRNQLDVVLALTQGFEVPAQACAKWRVLYVLCCKINVDVREQMRLEERELFSPRIRESTEASVCSDAMFR
ncbi:hemerythrin domain-containing protein [Brevundimonas sp.]|uniref:hemerythrin domain-containing protein n=1 Tax=Brevundimonas sp. TaxID=1871086 RepID=UPI002737BA21|nr:hemerythrin domain-containing protein [Brevundimonas sp.]MDP3803535.1 hemerythrin domain-containing protein [Brevundimonas sp.]